ncbi:6-bladed beta-propeller [Marinifilum caeruleilacunae]|uniref:6-bladed beta-propeller n=1 Tax=Marinifilum caeruleilacunae TaxID=2499076 RepID=A0ABX1X0V0_9BACT|nr:6-bladed beta-propeller [Marinifilum caeruleilacunae]NOU62022.1 6-bladed beta-propeller [Marinifilum caeruleilacunae]
MNRLIILLLLLGIFSCTQSSSKSKTEKLHEEKNTKVEFPYHVNLPDNGKDTLNLSKVSTEVNFVSLETNKKSLLRRVYQMEMNDTLILISDLRRLLLFKMDGSFVKQIGKNGKGPGEYIYVLDFQIKGDTIYIASSGKRSIIKYNLSGEFLEEKKLDALLAYFSIDEKNQIAWYDRCEGAIKFFNQDAQLIASSKFETFLKGRDRFTWKDSYDTYFQRSDSSLLVNNYLSDTIWSINDKRKKPAFIFNLGNELLPVTKQVGYYNGDFNKFERNASPYQKINIIHSDNYLMVFKKSWIEDDLNSIYLHSFDNQVTQKYAVPFVYDDLISHRCLNIRSELSQNGFMISVINAMDLCLDMEETKTVQEKLNPQTKHWFDKMSNVKEGDNPILAICRLKKR